ncbi:MAG: hypothetical protein RIB84_04690 [Sneathiellaceae bacterium]
MNADPIAVQPSARSWRQLAITLLVIGGGALALAMAGPARAGQVSIVAVETSEEGNDRFRFQVTLRHDDTGWEHYADRWEVRLIDGTVLGIRVLLHPHVDEQPFTRSLGGVVVPADVDRVFVHAHDKLDGWSPEAFEVALPGR